MNTQQKIILLVEDDPQSVLLVQRAVQQANISASFQVLKDVETAVGYLSGKNRFADREHYPIPTLILTNIKLRDKSGLELLAWIRQQPNLKSLPVVVVSNSGDPGEDENAKDLCASAYLVKPFSLDDLVDTLNLTMSHLSFLQHWRNWDWQYQF